jgi:sulfide:quinone oxidoreductase
MTVSLFEATEREPARVLIAGGGVAALEGLLALRALAPQRLTVDLLAPSPEFRPPPLSVAEPFGLAEPGRIHLEDFAAENGARLRRGKLASVDTHKRLALTAEGTTIGYDALLLAIGATSRPALSGALTFRGTRDVAALQKLLAEAEAGTVRSIAFALPPTARWSLPLYELALMTAARLAARQLQVRIELVTHERAPLAAFGPRASARIRSLLADAGIRLRTNARTLVAQPRRLFIAGGAIAADRVVALGSLAVPPIEGIPQRHHGFIPVDEHMRVEATPRVYAAGDATWYPLKQGGIAAQQAEAAAAAIAADAGVPIEPEPFVPVLRGVLLTGGKPQYIRDDDVAEAPLWSPVSKVAGSRLGPYLAGADRTLQPRLEDRAAPAEEHQAALELALQAADAAAGWQDHADALRWLRVAEGLNVALPMSYADKRRSWSALALAGNH